MEIAKRAGCRRAIKSKSMVSEEIELDAAMEEAGLEVVKTDLGEFILQISHDRPSHLCGPVIHKDKASIAKLFSEYSETAYKDDAQALTMQASAEHGRTVSLIPPVHVAIIEPAKMVGV